MTEWAISVVALTAVAAFWHWTQRSKGYPGNTFLFDPRDRHNDLLNTLREAHRPKLYCEQTTAPYFPVVFWVLRALTREKAVTVMRLAYGALAVVLAFQWGLPWWCSVAILLAYPAMLSDDRGNIDHIISSFSAIAVVLLAGGHPLWGAAVLGVAIACKGYAAPMGLLWLLRGDWTGIGIMAASAALLILAPARTFPGGIIPTLKGLHRSLGGFHVYASIAPRGPEYAVSHYCFDCLNFVRLLRFWSTGVWPDVTKWTKPYIVFSTTWAALLTWRACTTESLWVALLALGIFQAVWPYTANDYRLTTLVPGIAAWLMAGAPNPVVWTCLLLLWVPKAYWHPKPVDSWASISCIISPIAMVTLSVALWGV